MAWHYEKPKAKKLIIGPRTSWLYVPDDRAVYVQKAESLLKSRLTIRFFTGWENCGRISRSSTPGPMPSTGTETCCSSLRPAMPAWASPGFNLTVGRDDLQVHEVRFTDSFGNLTRLPFGISGRTFRYPTGRFPSNPQRASRFSTFHNPTGTVASYHRHPATRRGRHDDAAAGKPFRPLPRIPSWTGVAGDQRPGRLRLQYGPELPYEKIPRASGGKSEDAPGRFVLLSKLEESFQCGERSIPSSAPFPRLLCPAEKPPLRPSAGCRDPFLNSPPQASCSARKS